MKKGLLFLLLFSATFFASTLRAQEFQFMKFGYSISQGSFFNLSYTFNFPESRWGMHTYVGGYGSLGTIESGIDYDYNTTVIYDKRKGFRASAVVFGPTYRVLENTPLYLNVGIGYGIRTEERERYEKYDFQYLPDEYNLIYYEKNKDGVALHLGVGYEVNNWLGVEAFYNTHTGLGGGVTVGF